jgi:hypothetical protein
MEINLAEMQTLRNALDVITISGKDAIFIANLQSKLSNEITHLQTPQTPAETPPAKSSAKK